MHVDGNQPLISKWLFYPHNSRQVSATVAHPLPPKCQARTQQDRSGDTWGATGAKPGAQQDIGGDAWGEYNLLAVDELRWFSGYWIWKSSESLGAQFVPI